MHAHPPYATAQGCLKDPTLLPIHQNSNRFIPRMAYMNDYAIPDAKKEGENIGKHLGDKECMLMANHGTLVASDTVAIAFDETYYLERTCMYQMLALASIGGDPERLAQFDEKTVEEAAKFYNTENLELYANKHFYAWWNKYRNEGSNVFE